jgi:DNA-binding transcriptional LysR family regulator
MTFALDDNRLRYLFEAVRLGSVRAAADHLGVNPSVVSRQIAQLEREVNILLIERLSRGIRATEAGEFLVQRHRQWVADREDTMAKLREIQGLQRGHVSVIIGGGFVSDLMSGPLKGFWDRHPRLALTIDIGGSDEIAQAVGEDRFHIGVGYNVRPDPRVRFVATARRSICLVARPDHPLASAGPVGMAAINEHPLGLLMTAAGVRQRIAMAEAAEGVALTPRLTTSSIEVLRHFVQANMGVTLLPAFAIGADIAAGSLVAVPIDNPLLATTEAQVVTRLGRELPDAALQILRSLIREMRAFGPEVAVARA